ncbi:hypothetical protein [uncultured Dokdonia sp.]|uniref:hypothetical protein n=1 Tax=uncultured Dokdonia sp. TaxID=575653 RepID=UPI0026244239|nr:hypothetical protein [uncultured Dokdonia sp.]
MDNKRILFVISLCISINLFAQEERKIFSDEFKKFVLQCETIGNVLIDKNKEAKISDWYEGEETELIASYLKQLEADIDASTLEVTYYLVMLKENPLVYSFHFFNKETKEEFGQLFINFQTGDNILVDDLHYVSKAKIEMLDVESDKKTGLITIPPPPPPPPSPLKKKKKSGY